MARSTRRSATSALRKVVLLRDRDAAHDLLNIHATRYTTLKVLII
jgi:hypothetical protein